MRGVVAVALLALIGLGCGGGGTTGPSEPTAASLTAEGWRSFETDSLDTATARFTDALDLDPGYADARTGLGWVALRRNDFDGAETAFTTALSLDSTATAAWGGAVVTAAGRDRSTQVRSRGLELLDADPQFVFAHDPNFSASDVRWLVARAALDLGDDVTLMAQLDVLAPGNGLDPAAADFAERVLALLESLRGSV
jgi:cytochrome c-type biogenesis protein CcmH/NrfG